MRVGPVDLSYTDAQVWEDVWTHRKAGQQEFTKSRLAPASPEGVYGILGADRDDHARYRRLLSNAFSAQGLREQEASITAYVNKLMDGLAVASKTEGCQDILSWFNWTTFDLIGDLAFGESFKCLDDIRTHPWIRDLFGNLKFGAVSIALRHYGLLRLMNYLTPRKLLDARRENYRYVAEMIDRRIGLGKDRGDFFDHILKQPSERGQSLSQYLHNPLF